MSPGPPRRPPPPPFWACARAWASILEAWAATVQSMIDRGAELEPEEQKVLTDYLAANLAGPDASAPAAPAQN